ncbi:MAG: hypothetical protein ACR2JI_17185 [Mycobacterium sp.]
MSNRPQRKIALLAGTAALVGMGTMTACSTKEKPAETVAPSSGSSAPVSPTEKSAKPGGNNSFSPTVKAPPAPTALPGNVITGN